MEVASTDVQAKKPMDATAPAPDDGGQPPCNCLAPSEATDSAPPHRQLGSASTIQDLRRRLEARLNLPTPALRIETVAQAERDGATERGCPAAKWILRRISDQEKVLVLVRSRRGHACDAAVIVVALVSWEGVPKALADQAFDYLAGELPRRGIPSERRCAANENRTCACQGFDDATSGASYSFGCAWSMFHNACKFARTRDHARKFRLRSQDAESQLAGSLNCLADVAGRTLEAMAPDAFQALVRHSELAGDCRLGRDAPPSARPFSGVTACLDFCAHPHKDAFALEGGCNVVVTLARPQASEEQLHIFPGYVPDAVDEFNSEAGQRDRIARGDIQALRVFQKLTRVRGTPLAPCTARKKIKKAAQQQMQQQQKLQGNSHSTAQQQQKQQPKAASAKEEHSPASIDSGFESIKSNRSPDKDEQHQHQQHQSPPTVVPQGTLPPIASWFRKSAIQWSPQQQQQQRQPQTQPQPPPQPLQQPPPQPQGPPSGTASAGCYPPDPRAAGQQHHMMQPAGSRPDLHLQYYHQQGAASQPHGYPPRPGMPYQQQHPQQHHHQQPSSAYARYPPGGDQHPQAGPSAAAAYPGSGYPPNWRPQQPAGNGAPGPYYCPQPGQQRMPQQSYRPYPQQYPQQQQQHPPYQQQQHPVAYDYDYPHHPQYYQQQQQQHPHHQQHPMPPYSQFYPGYPQQQRQPQQAQLQLQQQQIPPNPGHAQLAEMPVQSEPQPKPQAQTQPQLQPPHPPPPQPPSTLKRPGGDSNPDASSSATTTSSDQEFLSDCAELFKDERMGGLAIALTHGSVLIEAAKYDSHATTAMKRPDRNHPTALSLVYFQHKSLCYAHHGYSEYAEKMRLLRQRRAEANEAKAEVKTQANADVKVEILAEVEAQAN